MNIFQRISLKLKVIKRFKPFFANQNDSLKSLEIMDFQLTQDIVSIYEKICELPKNKYKKERILYETYLSKIEEHNTFVDRANSLVFRWSLSKILENPLIVEKEYLVDCSTLADELKKYKLTGKYKIFKKEITEVFNNFEVICRQYELHKQYVALFDFGCGNYINEFQKNNVKMKGTPNPRH